jgi:uncharacterized protein (DUF362 family)
MSCFASDVTFLPCAEYDRERIATAIDALTAPLVLPNLHGSRVLLKPNLISTTGPALASTAAEFAAGAAIWLREQGAQVFLGDSPAFGSAQRVCDRHGISEALRGLEVELVEFRHAVHTRLACGVTLPIAAEALECDMLVGLPRIKAHQQMYMTLALKNLFGVVKGTHKSMLHMKLGGDDAHARFARIIFDLHLLFPHQLHLIDGIVAMHRSGPMNGDPLPLGVVGASLSPVALDSAVLSLLNVNREASPLWQIARELACPGWDVGEINFPLKKPDEFLLPHFATPAQLNPVRFSILRYLRGMGRRLFKEPFRTQ